MQHIKNKTMKKQIVNILIFSLLTISCSEDTNNTTPIVNTQNEYNYTYSGQVAGYDYQDLGLSVKWATKNLGAQNYYDAGYYISWGENMPKGEYTWQSYQHYDTQSKTITKYTELTEDENNLVRLEPSDDAATVNMGDQWRIPTDKEITELRTKCDWTYLETDNGNIGYIVTGPNGKSIFIPACGYMKNQELKMFNKSVCLWSSNLSMRFAAKAYELTGYNSSDNEVFRYEGMSERYYGEPIRAVTNSN